VYYPCHLEFALPNTHYLCIRYGVTLAICRRLLSLFKPAWRGIGMAFMLAVGWGAPKSVSTLYPQYNAFYEGAFYNVMAYQVALLGLNGACLPLTTPS
jgi:hypothetical protein